MDIRQSKLPATLIWGYAAAAIGYNLLFGVVNNFLMYFYTDILLISAAAGGTIMLVARLWDGINDPIMGSIVDRSNPKFGKYRSFILWGAIPLGLFAVLTFTAPDLSTNGKVIYGGAMYILFGMAYTISNIPYMAMQATITYNQNERTKLISIKSMVAGLAIIGGAAAFKPLVDLFPSEKQGFTIAISILVVIALISIMTAFKATKEYAYYSSGNEKEKIKFREKIRVITKNKPAVIIMSMIFVISVMQAIMMSTPMYYATYNLGKPELIGVFMALNGIMIPAMILTPVLQKKIGKVPLFVTGLSITGISSLIIYFIPYNQIGIILALNGLKAFGFGFSMVLIWAMVADCVDYGAYKTGIYSSAIVFSSTTFLQKAGMAIGGWLLGMILTIIKYVPNQEQTPEALQGILLLVSIVPAAFQLIAIIIMKFYPLNESKMEEVLRALKEGEE